MRYTLTERFVHPACLFFWPNALIWCVSLSSSSLLLTWRRESRPRLWILPSSKGVVIRHPVMNLVLFQWSQNRYPIFVILLRVIIKSRSCLYITHESNLVQRGLVTIETPISSTLCMKANQVQPSRQFLFTRFWFFAKLTSLASVDDDVCISLNYMLIAPFLIAQ